MNNLELAVQFFLQLAVILVFCRLVGFLAARLGDREVAREVLEAMRAAGYVERAYSPELARDRLFFRFPEALRLLG